MATRPKSNVGASRRTTQPLRRSAVPLPIPLTAEATTFQTAKQLGSPARGSQPPLSHFIASSPQRNREDMRKRSDGGPAGSETSPFLKGGVMLGLGPTASSFLLLYLVLT
jgi:hypothetical protein